MSMHRHFVILVAVGLVFVATTAGYVAFLSGNASGRAGAPLLKRNASHATVRMARPSTPSGREASAGSEDGAPVDLAPLISTQPSVALGDPATLLTEGAFAVSTTELSGWSRGSSSGSPSAPGVNAFGGPSPSRSSASLPGLPPRLFPGEDTGLDAIVRAPSSQNSGSSPLPEPAAPLTFAVSALIVAALLRRRTQHQP